MACFAHIGGIDVRGTLAGGRRAVMTTDTVTGDRTVIHGRTQPGRSGMADITFLCRRNMGGPLTGCGDIVMTAGAGSNDLRVIHCHHRYPGSRRVARFAHTGGTNVAWPLTDSSRAVMTGNTGAIHLCVVHCHDWSPQGC